MIITSDARILLTSWTALFYEVVCGMTFITLIWWNNRVSHRITVADGQAVVDAILNHFEITDEQQRKNIRLRHESCDPKDVQQYHLFMGRQKMDGPPPAEGSVFIMRAGTLLSEDFLRKGDDIALSSETHDYSMPV